MEQKILAYVTEQTQALLAAPSACPEIKNAAKSWLAAAGSDGEAEATKKYLLALEAAVMPLEGLAAFSESEAARQILGADGARNLQEHVRELKAQGASTCDCAACTACKAILAQKETLLKNL